MIDIRRAVAADAQTLTEIALAAKRHWGYPEDWMRLWTPALTITPELIASLEVWLAAQTDEVLGFCALRCKGHRATLEHLWIRPEHLRQGVGTRLFEHAVERARSAGCRVLQVESDPNARGYYENMGARQVREVHGRAGDHERILPILELPL